MAGGARREGFSPPRRGLDDDRLTGWRGKWKLKLLALGEGGREGGQGRRRLICLQRLACVVRCGPVALEMPARVSEKVHRSVVYSYLVPRASCLSGAGGVSCVSQISFRCPSFVPLLLLSKSATPAGSNSRLVMQGRDDRETRGSELIACKISCLARCVSRYACCVPEQCVPRDVQSRENRVDKSMFGGDGWGNGRRSTSTEAGGWYITASYYSHARK